MKMKRGCAPLFYCLGPWLGLSQLLLSFSSLPLLLLLLFSRPYVFASKSLSTAHSDYDVMPCFT
jgi:hypothetical protein